MRGMCTSLSRHCFPSLPAATHPGTIVAKATGMCLDGTCATVGAGGCDPVPFVPCDGSPAQSWTLDPATHHVVNGEFGS